MQRYPRLARVASHWAVYQWVTRPTLDLASAARRELTTDTAQDPSLYARLKRELKQSMRQKAQPRLTVIRSVLSDITYAEKANLMKHTELSAEANKTQAQTDSTIVSIIQAAQKKRRDAIELYQSQQREDLAAKERAELAVLGEFLPEPYSASQVEALVRTAIQTTQAASVKDLGRVIQAVDADPARVTKAQLAQAAKQLLATP